jgi:hypothetical protein
MGGAAEPRVASLLFSTHIYVTLLVLGMWLSCGYAG